MKQVLAKPPVSDAVVSNYILGRTESSTCHSRIAFSTVWALTLPIPLSSFLISRNLFFPILEISGGSLCTFSFLMISGMSFPFQCAVDA